MRMSASPLASSPGDGRRPLLSVVMPTHDVAPWIRETLDSVLRQDLRDLEVVVVDDHSTDGTAEIVARFAAQDPRVRLIQAERRGGGSARNLGIDRARGAYLAFCDGDDLVPDGAYTALVGSLERSGSDIAFGDYLKFRAVDTWRPTDRMRAFDRPAEGVSLLQEPTLLYSRPCWNKAFRRSFWDGAGIRFPDVPRSNDIVPMVQAYVAAARVDIVPDVVYVYRERPGDRSMSARAASAASQLSYLGQEAQCARLVAEAADDALSRVYGALVWDRDGYVHIAAHLLAWTAPTADDDRVAAALAELLTLTRAPEAGEGEDAVDPLRRLVMILAARGEFRAARGLARVVEHNPWRAEVDGAETVDDWTVLLERLAHHDLIGPREREALTERLARRLTADPPPTAWGTWRALVAAARDALGERALMFAPEAWQEPARDAARGRLRRGLDPVVEGISGGERVELTGSVDAEAAAAVDPGPVLFDGLRSAASGRVEHVPPADVAWGPEEDGRRRWTAVFPASALPLHRPLTPVIADRRTGEVVSARSACWPPPYAPRDRFLYDRIDGVLVVRRRRHWIPRALRRAVLVVRERVRRSG